MPFPIDVVDVFRRSEAAGEFADQAVAVGARAVWFQLGVVDEEAFARTTAAGVPMVMDTCPAIEWRRAGVSRPGDDLVVPPGPGLPAGLVIPAAELVERFSRSPGPGGQSVNTSDSRVELVYDVAASTALTDARRRRALSALAGQLVGGTRRGRRLRAPLPAPQPGRRPRAPRRAAPRRRRPAAAPAPGHAADPGVAAPPPRGQEAARRDQGPARAGHRRLTRAGAAMIRS